VPRGLEKVRVEQGVVRGREAQLHERRFRPSGAQQRVPQLPARLRVVRRQLHRARERTERALRVAGAFEELPQLKPEDVVARAQLERALVGAARPLGVARVREQPRVREVRVRVPRREPHGQLGLVRRARA
jgi:hypothetical protein